MLEHTSIDSALKYLLDEMHHVLVVLDLDFNIQKVNNQFEKLTDQVETSIVGKNLLDVFIPQEKRETISKSLRAVIDNKYLMHAESPIVTKTGRKVLIEWDNSPILQNDVCIGVVCLGIDVTGRHEIEELLKISEEKARLRAELLEKQNKDLEERKLAMIKLLEEEKKLERSLQLEKASVEKKVKDRTYELTEQRAQLMAAINSVPHGFIVADKDHNFIITNDKMDDIFNISVGKWDLEMLQKCLGNEISVIEKIDYSNKNMDSVLVKDIDVQGKILQLYIAPVFIGQISSIIVGSVILITDITEERILERSKDEFLSIASHELRTPITAIRGNIDLIRRYYAGKIDDHDFREMLDDISASSTRLIDLVNEFLNTSRLEQGKIHFEYVPFDVIALSESVVDEIQTVAMQKKLYIKLNKPDISLPLVKGDANRVKEVLINLLSNAINYTDTGGTEISFDNKDGYVKVSVKDTGRGIHEKDQKYLFRKFQQANINLYTRDASHSTGLGLYISRLIIEGLNGRIYLESSKLGEGSTFCFTLPIANVDE